MMATMTELCTKTLTEVATLIREKEVSPVELTGAMLDRISMYDGQLHSYVTVTSNLALQQARKAEEKILRGGYRGPLHGVPIAVKDLFYTQNVPTTCGSPILSDWVPEYDATVIERLYAAGAVLLGKLTMTEFANISYHPSIQPAISPWNPGRWPGASSSGSGVATIASLCFGSLGSDTGGSIRFPAAACGVVGVKPTYGKVSRYGVFPLAASLDHVGPITRSVADAAVMLHAIAGFDSNDPTTRREPVPDFLESLSDGVVDLRIGVDEAYITTEVDPEISGAVLKAVRLLGDLGAGVREVKLSLINEAVAAWWVTLGSECAAAHEEKYSTWVNDYSPSLRAVIESGAKIPGSEYAKAYVARQAVCRMFDNLFQEIDILVYPTMGMAPPSVVDLPPDGTIRPELAEMLLRFIAPANVSGVPAMSVPCGFNSEGLPIGLQIVGRPGDEETLLRVGYAYEQATDWHRQRPLI